MEMIEIVKCLRWFVSRLSHVDQETVGKILTRIEKDYKQYEYRLLVNLLSLLPAVKYREPSKLASLIVKIHQRIQELKRVDIHPSFAEESSKLKDEA